MKKCVWLGMAAALILAVGCDEALQDGTISGTVKDGGNAVGGAYVLLLDEGELVVGNTPLSNGSITQGNGNYIILAVQPDKNYYIAAIEDEDHNGAYTPGVDEIGYHGTYNPTTHIWIPASVHVSSGQKLTGINVNELYQIPVP